MVAAGSPGADVAAGTSLWLDEVSLDTLGVRAAELVELTGASGLCARPPSVRLDETFLKAVLAAAKALRPAFDRGAGRDGWVSVGAPRGETAAELLRLARLADAPNVLPQAARLEDARAVLREGRPVHLARLTTLKRLDAALEAWFAELELLAKKKRELGAVHFVLGFDLRRLDAAVDGLLSARMDAAPTDSIRAAYRLLLGRVGVSTAKLANRRLRTALNGERFRRLLAAGARPPRLAWSLGAGHLGRLGELAGGAAIACFPAEVFEEKRPAPAGEGLFDDADDAKRKLDKLANYQIDLDVIGAELEASS